MARRVEGIFPASLDPEDEPRVHIVTDIHVGGKDDKIGLCLGDWRDGDYALPLLTATHEYPTVYLSPRDARDLAENLMALSRGDDDPFVFGRQWYLGWGFVPNYDQSLFVTVETDDGHRFVKVDRYDADEARFLNTDWRNVVAIMPFPKIDDLVFEINEGAKPTLSGEYVVLYRSPSDDARLVQLDLFDAETGEWESEFSENAISWIEFPKPSKADLGAFDPDPEEDEDDDE